MFDILIHSRSVFNLLTTVLLPSDAEATIFLAAHFCATTIQGGHLFLWKTRRHQRWLDKVRTSDTVTTVKHCQ